MALFPKHRGLQRSGRAGQCLAVPETIESARRWSGYVCPDCRFVFRVPRDHDGKGVVCPACRRMLRIPVAGQELPPLVVPLKGTAPEQPDPGTAKGSKRRRKRKPRKGESHAWDEDGGAAAGSMRGEKRQMFWMMVGGGTLFAAIVVGVVAMLSGDAQEAPQVQAPPANPAGGAAVPGSAPVVAKSDTAILAEAEPLIRSFLEGTRVETLLPLVRDAAVVEGKMRRHYPGGLVEAPGMAKTDPISQLTRLGSISTVRVRTADFDERLISFEETPAGLRIDWESWVGWSDLPWEDFFASKPTVPQVFRVRLSPVEYFNFGFSDDRKWQSYRLESPDGEHSVFGYVERGSSLASRLLPSPDSKAVPLTLALRFPENATSANQVVIEKYLAEGWVLDRTETP